MKLFIDKTLGPSRWKQVSPELWSKALSVVMGVPFFIDLQTDCLIFDTQSREADRNRFIKFCLAGRETREYTESTVYQ